MEDVEENCHRTDEKYLILYLKLGKNIPISTSKFFQLFTCETHEILKQLIPTEMKLKCKICHGLNFYFKLKDMKNIKEIYDGSKYETICYTCHNIIDSQYDKIYKFLSEIEELFCLENSLSINTEIIFKKNLHLKQQEQLKIAWEEFSHII